MAHHAGVRIVGAQAVEQGTEGGALRLGACVGRMAVGGETALVADADAVLVEPLGMSALLMVTLPSAIVVYCTCNSFFDAKIAVSLCPAKKGVSHMWEMIGRKINIFDIFSHENIAFSLFPTSCLRQTPA